MEASGILKGRLRLCLFLGGLLLLTVSPALDQPLLDWSRQNADEGILAHWGVFAYYAGLATVQYLLLALIGMIFWLTWHRSAILVAATGAAGVALSGIATQVIKHLVGRPRPRIDWDSFSMAGLSWGSDFHSFPSGHTSTSVALACIFAARYPDKAWIFYTLAALVGIGRVLSGSHYASDVLGGAVLGLAVSLPLCRLVYKPRETGV